MEPRCSRLRSKMEMLGTTHSTRPSSALVGSTLQPSTAYLGRSEADWRAQPDKQLRRQRGRLYTWHAGRGSQRRVMLGSNHAFSLLTHTNGPQPGAHVTVSYMRHRVPH